MTMLYYSLLSLALYGVVNSFEQGTSSPVHQHIFPFNPLCPRSDTLSHSCDSSHEHEKEFNTSLPFTLEPQPWTIEPTCTNIPNTTDQFCAFTSTTLYNSRGITILTKPSIANLIGKKAAFSTPQNYTLSTLSEHDTRDTPYEVRDIPGRGKGVIATRRIERGELLFAHSAIAIFHDDTVDKDHIHYLSHQFPIMKQSIDQLPASSKQNFLSMAAHDPGEPYIERIYTNAFGGEFGGEEHSVIVPEAARMNHDCRPNTMYYFDTQMLVHYTHASRPILAGEEITVTYIDPLQTRLQRRKVIKDSWGFDCTCSLCSQEQTFVRESNRRIRQILELNEVFEGMDRRRRKVPGTVEMAELLVTLYEQERLYATAVEGYRFTALSYSAVGRKWEALKWAGKAVEAGLVHDGPKEEGVRDMMQLLDDDVEDHWSWGANLHVEDVVAENSSD